MNRRALLIASLAAVFALGAAAVRKRAAEHRVLEECRTGVCEVWR